MMLLGFVAAVQGYTPFDRETIKLAERLPREAATLTQQEYAQKSNYIQARIRYRDDPKAERDVKLTQEFGEAAHKYAGTQPTPGAENAPKAGLLGKEAVVLKTQVMSTTPATSIFTKTLEAGMSKLIHFGAALTSC